ncbi:2'-5' RNA ligase family protein [Chitinophaga sp. 22620]|jgi:2'-5' RNA ligase|uniref:2'-5' RNA ligase family protein n=1 Tax=Chitinophaga sp. 22620 TaxID=3453952 RepID=UPI003F83FD21
MEQDVLYDYMLVLQPDAQTVQDVSMYKHLIAEELGPSPGAFSQAHIALFRSEFPARYEAEFILMLDALVADQSAFTVYTSRIDHCRQGETKHMFYVNVANPRPVEELHRRILDAFELKAGSYKPHITLARSVSQQHFNQLAPYLANKMFVRSFHCQSFSLLRKPVGGGKYETVREFMFGKDTPARHPLFNHAA